MFTCMPDQGLKYLRSCFWSERVLKRKRFILSLANCRGMNSELAEFPEYSIKIYSNWIIKVRLSTRRGKNYDMIGIKTSE